MDFSNLNYLLDQLYPGKNTPFQDLVLLLKDFKKLYPSILASKKNTFTQKDVFFICYADHVRREDEKTLPVLHHFLNKYVKGIVNTIHILPFYPYSSDDGFSVIDYYKVKKEYGDWGDIKKYSDDFKLMFDVVINHISAQSEWFQEFLKGNPKYEDYFIAYDEAVDTSNVFRPRTHPLLTKFVTEKGTKFVWTTFSADQIDLNTKNPEVFLELIKIILFYLSEGATDFRLDAIAYLWKEVGSKSVHLKETHTFIQIIREVMKLVSPKTILITETNFPHAENISYFGNGENEAQMVYNFTLPPLLYYSFFKQNSVLLTKWAQSLKTPSVDTAFFNFTASHDGIGITQIKNMIPETEYKNVLEDVAKKGGKISYRTGIGGVQNEYELNITYLDAMGSVPAFLASQAIALSLQGIPAIYFNSLFGGRNFQEGVEKYGYNRIINRQKYNGAILEKDVSDPRCEKSQIYHAYHHLLEVRAKELLFSPHVPQTIINLDQHVFCIVRTTKKEKLIVLINISAKKITLSSKKLAAIVKKENAIDLISEHVYSFAEKQFVLQPYQILWLK